MNAESSAELYACKVVSWSEPIGVIPRGEVRKSNCDAVPMGESQTETVWEIRYITYVEGYRMQHAKTLQTVASDSYWRETRIYNVIAIQRAWRRELYFGGR